MLAEILVDVSGYKLPYTEAVQAHIVSHFYQVWHTSTECCITGMACVREGKTHYVGGVLHALDGMHAINSILFVAGYCIAGYFIFVFHSEVPGSASEAGNLARASVHTGRKMLRTGQL